MKVIFCLIAFCSFASELEMQRELFQKQGFLWIKNFFSKSQVELISYWADLAHKDGADLLKFSQMTNQPLKDFAKKFPNSLIVVPETKNKDLICRVEDMLTVYPELYQLIHGTVTAYTGLLLEEPYVLFKDKLNFKWPGGGAFTPHQDYPAYECFGPSEYITALVCIDAATEENGCLRVAINCSDVILKKEVLPYIVGGKNHGSIVPEALGEFVWLDLKTEPGDVVLFSSYVPHYSEPNMSDKPRRAMFFTQNRLSEGDHRRAYYQAKRDDPENPLFHIATPTDARSKGF